jgi:hypothetical protein
VPFVMEVAARPCTSSAFTAAFDETFTPSRPVTPRIDI